MSSTLVPPVPPSPPPARPRARRKDDARARILAEARRIVLEQGFEALTMRRIADAAGYSPAALYLHFENREAIARELGESGMKSLLSGLAAAAATPEPVARLKALGLAYVAFARAEPDTYRLIFMEEGFASTALGGKDEAGAAAFRLLAGAFAALADEGRLRQGHDPNDLAITFWILLHGTVSLKLTCSAFLSPPEETLLATALDSLLTGVLRAAPQS